MSITVGGAEGIVNVIDNFDRPRNAYAEGPYAGTGTYAHAFNNKPGERVPKAGAVAEAGVGRAGAAWGVYSAGAKGPNASAKAEANVLGAGAIARAEIGSVSAVAGPVSVKLGLGVDTGVTVSPTKVELKFLGTGLTLGEEMGISLLGNEVKCSVM
ncbi:hypothetical protein AMELA_G00109210 [Ameiurus melas]|uniref:Uncharacterized protein n=1 Tax=Ameiurus melas TaxID=219545 RepID=A0A7J6AQ61_AMEME|nr:hypothetical protein AMELA_G00109210 [Ameiurus melas]